MNVQQKIFAGVYNEYERGQSSPGLLDPFDHRHEWDDDIDVPPCSEPAPLSVPLGVVMKQQGLLLD